MNTEQIREFAARRAWVSAVHAVTGNNGGQSWQTVGDVFERVVRKGVDDNFSTKPTKYGRRSGGYHYGPFFDSVRSEDW